ncbi:MAG: phage tail protein [Methylotenera sp.]
MMQNRSNSIFDHIVNKGIVISKLKGTVQANKMMKIAGIPDRIIERVLFEPQKLRSTDWS